MHRNIYYSAYVCHYSQRNPNASNSHVFRNPPKKEKERRVVFMKPLWVRDAAKITLV